MKKLDKLVLLSFSGPFILTLFTVIFILLTPVLIRFGDELVGKDLGIGVILELFGYMAIKSTQDAVPLAILIASLIAFGNLGEHSEITAIKSAGISLLRVLFPLFILVCGITFLSYINNNNIVPKANLKFWSLLWDVRQKKPALNLKEGIFYYDIPNYSIKTDKKYPDGAMKGVLIYDHSSGHGNTDVIIADSGRMYTFYGDQYLMLELYDGYSFSEDPGAGPRQRNYLDKEDIGEFFRSKFDSSRMVFSMESFEMTRTREELFQGSRLMKNMAELKLAADSVRKEKYLEQSRLFNQINNSYNYYLAGKFTIPPYDPSDTVKLAWMDPLNAEVMEGEFFQTELDEVDSTILAEVPTDTVMVANQEKQEDESTQQTMIMTARARREMEERARQEQLRIFEGTTIEFLDQKKSFSMDSIPPYRDFDMVFVKSQLGNPNMQSQVIGTAVSQVRLIVNTLDIMSAQINNQQKEVNKYELEYHGKVARAFTCLVMFLIGAPLGAIIKRGGLGVPVLVAVGFFIFYYSLTIASEKLGKEGILSPFMAMWGANFLLLPVGLFFLRQARIDARLFDTDFYATVMSKLRGKKKPEVKLTNVQSLDELEEYIKKEEESAENK